MFGKLFLQLSLLRLLQFSQIVLFLNFVILCLIKQTKTMINLRNPNCSFAADVINKSIKFYYASIQSFLYFFITVLRTIGFLTINRNKQSLVNQTINNQIINQLTKLNKKRDENLPLYQVDLWQQEREREHYRCRQHRYE